MYMNVTDFQLIEKLIAITKSTKYSYFIFIILRISINKSGW